jgi:hypothetical protein
VTVGLTEAFGDLAEREETLDTLLLGQPSEASQNIRIDRE